MFKNVEAVKAWGVCEHGVMQHGICARKMHKNANKKEFLYTICAEAKNLDFPGRIELVDTITRAWGNLNVLY